MSDSPRTQVFISYSHKDSRWLEILQIHLKPLVRQGRITTWDDRKITPGSDWRSEIRSAIDKARVALLLVSPDFLASDFIEENELPPLLEAAQREGVVIFWIAVRKSSYHKTPIERYQAANNPFKPLASLKVADRDNEMVKICERLEAIMGQPASFPVSNSPSGAERFLSRSKEGNSRPLHITILYKRGAEPDEQVLKLVETELLRRGYSVFTDRNFSVGVEWAEEIHHQIGRSDVVIPLLSPASVSSEIIVSEIQIAYELARQQGIPHLLPIRIRLLDSLPSILETILNQGQHFFWEEQEDNEELLSTLLTAIQREPAPRPLLPPRKFNPVGGALPLDSQFYIIRPTDDDFAAAIDRQDSIVLIKGARQMGKTSLLARGLQQARDSKFKVILTDFQMLSSAQLESADAFFAALAEIIADQLHLDTSPEEVWSPRSGPSINFQKYLQRYGLAKISGHIIWGMDEVDRLFTCNFGSDVFGLFRSWHNARSLDPTGPWRRLTLAIAYATEAHLFITNINQSPFNVGTQLTMDDFTFEQVGELNRRYGYPLNNRDELIRYFGLVGGHPYLVQHGFHEIVARSISLPAFEAHADSDEGPLGSHLRRILLSVAQEKTLLEAIRTILQGQPNLSDDSFYRLRSAGIILGNSKEHAKLRCEIYVKYLKRHLL